MMTYLIERLTTMQGWSKVKSPMKPRVQSLNFSLMLAVIRKLVYLMARLSPRTTNKAVFGSYKNRFCDNAKYLYLHWHRTGFIRCIWIGGDKAVIETLKSRGLEAYYRWSLAGIYHGVTARYYIYNSYIGDINQYLANGAVKINLWHGSPMKTIESDIKTGPMARVYNPPTFAAGLVHWLIYHQQGIKPDIMLSPSPLIDSLFGSAFHLTPSQLVRAGNPRTDFYGRHPDERLSIRSGSLIPVERSQNSHAEGNPDFLANQYATIILYAPSWRDNLTLYMPSDSPGAADPYSPAFDWPALSKQLVKKNQLFLLRLHPNEAELALALGRLPNIINISDLEDVYGLLHDVDLLITDYSSLFIDILPQDIPVIFYCFDRQDYRKNCREMYDYVDKLPMPGPEVSSFNALQGLLERDDFGCIRQEYEENYQAARALFWQQASYDAFDALESVVGPGK